MAYRLSECIAIGVPDMEKAAAFYEDVLGFELGRREEDWVEVRAGAVRLFLLQDPFIQPAFDLVVPDAEEAIARLITAGCEKVDLGSQETFLRDPFGQVFCISEGEV